MPELLQNQFHVYSCQYYFFQGRIQIPWYIYYILNIPVVNNNIDALSAGCAGWRGLVLLGNLYIKHLFHFPYSFRRCIYDKVNIMSCPVISMKDNSTSSNYYVFYSCTIKCIT